jgi:hypothetical protein
VIAVVIHHKIGELAKFEKGGKEYDFVEKTAKNFMKASIRIMCSSRRLGITKYHT